MVSSVITLNSHWEPIKRGRLLILEGRREKFIRTGPSGHEWERFSTATVPGGGLGTRSFPGDP